MQETGWRARADEAFLVRMPGTARIVVEMAFLLVLVFGENVLMVSPLAAAVLLAAELALGMALVRPWARVQGGLASRVAATVLVVIAVAAPAAVEHPGFAGASRKLGVEIAAGAPEAGDPPTAGGSVRIESVEAHAPADGVLRPGDRVVALDGAPLDQADPVSDLTQRTHGDDLPEETTVTILRDGATRVLAVRIPRVHDRRRAFGRRVGAIRELSSRHIVVAAATRGVLLIVLLLLLLRADGQPVASLGIARLGALSELAAGAWMTLGTFAVQIAVAIPVALIGALAGIVNHEASQRTEALGVIAGQGSVVEFIPAVIAAAAFEEVAFRGFLVPRLRQITGSWPLAVVGVSVVFGLGHVYEGALAVVQTACLGMYFSAMLLLRRRLLGPIAAHAAFNTAMLLVVRALLAGGVLDRLKALAPH
jgi:membrane protease YdiL (CAAX protease family)